MARANTFNTAAKILSRAPFDFEAAVAEAYTQNPALADSVYFIDISKGQMAHPDKAMMADVLAFISNSDAGRQFIQPKIDECRRHKTSYCHGGGGGSSFVYLYTGEDRLRFFSGKVSAAEEMLFIFDHEFAHAHIPAAQSDNRFLAETAADSYALIRHIQRFGQGSALAREVVGFRAHDTAFRAQGILNFSCPALEYILKNPKKIDYAALTPAQTSALAADIALGLLPEEKTLRALHQAFSPVHNGAGIAALRDIAVTSKDADVLKWSATALKAALAKAPSAPSKTAYRKMRAPIRPASSPRPAQSLHL